MGIQPKSPLYSIWVQTLLEAIHKNFVVNKNTGRCDTYFEDGETVAVAFFYLIIKEKYSEQEAINLTTIVWPSINRLDFVLERTKLAMSNARYTKVKRGLILNYFKFKKINYDSVS